MEQYTDFPPTEYMMLRVQSFTDDHISEFLPPKRGAASVLSEFLLEELDNRFKCFDQSSNICAGTGGKGAGVWSDELFRDVIKTDKQRGNPLLLAAYKDLKHALLHGDEVNADDEVSILFVSFDCVVDFRCTVVTSAPKRVIRK